MVAGSMFAQTAAIQSHAAKQGNSSKGDYAQLTNTRSTVLSEDFEAWPPENWTIVDGANSQGTQHWHQAQQDAPYNKVAMVTYDDNGDATARPQDEWMISPEVVVPESAFLRFYLNTSVHWFIDPNDNADLNVKISTDDGATWTQLLNEADVDGLETYKWKEVLIDLSAYATQTVKVAFQYVGQDAASCGIDNVELFGQPSYDAQMVDACINFNYVDDPDYHNGGNYHLSGHFSRIPKPVLDENNTIMLFNAVVKNFGLEESVINCEVKVLDPNDEEVYSQTVASQPMASGEIDTLDIGWTDETVFSLESYLIGDYQVVYNLTIEGQTDEVMNNNTQTIIVEATDGVYSRAYGREINGYTGPTAWVGGAAGDEVLTSYHMMFPSEMEEGEYAEITSVDAYIHSETSVDQSFYATISFYDSNLAEWVTLGSSALIVVDETMIDNLVNVTFADPIYVIKDSDGFVNVRLSMTVNDNPTASKYLFFATEEVPTEGWSTQWIINGGAQGSDPYTISNFTDEVPIFSLNVDFFTSVNDVVFNAFNVYPNPTNGNLTIENVEDATIEVFNMLGKCVAVVNNADFRTNINMSNLAEGTYVVRVTAEEGVGMRKVNLVK